MSPHMHRAASHAFLVCALFTSFETSGPCQESPAVEAPQALGAARGVQMAPEGGCPEAMPLLDQAMRDTGSGLDVKRKASFAGVRCSMTLNRQNDAMSFIAWLQQAYPKDPEVLFLAVHVFSDLSLRSSQDLLDTAPGSPLVIQLNAENFEKQGDLAKAIAEYRVLLQRQPDKVGIHYRIGGLIMSQAGTATSPEDARQEFEQELKLNPRNASAEYYLGELARQGNHLPAAIEHYSRATTL